MKWVRDGGIKLINKGRNKYVRGKWVVGKGKFWIGLGMGKNINRWGGFIWGKIGLVVWGNCDGEGK